MARRKGLSIRQRHTRSCPRRGDCGCSWYVVLRGSDGRQKRISGATRRDVEQSAYEFLADRAEPVADKTTTIAQWADQWLASGESRGWRRGTMHFRECAVRNHIVPRLGHYLVTELRKPDVRRWVDMMRRNGVGPNAMHDAYRTLRTMYGDWQRDDRLLPRGIPLPEGLVKRPRPRREGWDPLTPGQVEQLIAAMPPFVAPIARVQECYGARASEAQALREEDVLFNRRDVRAPLGPQLARLAALSADDYVARNPRLRFARKLEVDGTPGPIKNERGNRTRRLPQHLAAVLAQHLADWPSPDGWLFTQPVPWGHHGADGVRQYLPVEQRRPWRQRSYDRWFDRAVEATGIELPPGQRTHALRHYCGSRLLAEGWTYAEVADWLGDTPAMIVQVYGHVMAGDLDRKADQLAAGRSAAGGQRLRAVE